ncbi:peptidylprolyl isomerase [Pendulispora albinea]|uniref:peptidylprolyl isomerase n=1 Tax=Pendulispora albinea TaxID=2741071 RepID=A0ABZ2LW23_9BACT
MVDKLRRLRGVRGVRAALVALLLVHAPATYAEAPGAKTADAGAGKDGARAAVVARVGARTVTAGELEDRLAAIPAFQLRTWGATQEAVKKAVLEQVIVPELLLDQGAEAGHVERDLDVAQRLVRARAEATVRALRAQVGGPAAVSAEDVKRYFEENRARFEAPERYNLWRILCKTREEALSVLESAKKDGQLAKFQELAEKHSLDKATHLRGGNLGFVDLEGVSNEAGLRVEPGIVKAAMAVKDGEFVPTPVEEAGSWAVIWRRGTSGAVRRTLDELTPQLRDLIAKQRLSDAQTKLLDELRARNVRDLNESLLQGLEIGPKDSAVVPRKRPQSP